MPSAILLDVPMPPLFVVAEDVDAVVGDVLEAVKEGYSA
jgi:hypothetical protein